MIELSNLDTSKGVGYTNDNEELYRRILGDFLEDYRDAVERLRELASSDLENCIILAHSIKGLTAILGSDSLPELFCEIEIAAKTKVEDLNSKIDNVEAPFNALITELESLDL
jgi:HPt (histidine-containing phosphotransfer) domain-containing protein